MKISLLAVLISVFVMSFGQSAFSQSAEETQTKVQALKQEIQDIQANAELSQEEKTEMVTEKRAEMKKLRAAVKAGRDANRAKKREEKIKQREASKAEIDAIKNNPDLSDDEKEKLILAKREELNPGYAERMEKAQKQKPKASAKDDKDAYQKHLEPMKAEIQKLKEDETLSMAEKSKKEIEIREAYRKSWKERGKKEE